MPDYIENDEVLYRSIRNNPHFFKEIDGAVKFSSIAFNDPAYQPSVDRSILRNSPEETKLYPTDGVTKLVAVEARKVTVPIAAADPTNTYDVDVIYCPIEAGNPDGLTENPAHSQIEAAPTITVERRFDKIKEALARIATRHGWIVTPS
jgi:hypothetical protein